MAERKDSVALRSGNRIRIRQRDARVGAKRRRQLLSRFGSVAGVERASVEELQQALGPRVGQRLHDFLHPPEAGEPI